MTPSHFSRRQSKPPTRTPSSSSNNQEPSSLLSVHGAPAPSTQDRALPPCSSFRFSISSLFPAHLSLLPPQDTMASLFLRSVAAPSSPSSSSSALMPIAASSAPQPATRTSRTAASLLSFLLVLLLYLFPL